MTDRERLPNRRGAELLDFEHGGRKWTVGVGRFGDGRIAATAGELAAPSAEAKAAADAMRIEAIEEAADLAIPFLVGVRQAARDGDVTRLGECLQAVRLASVVMLQAFGELGDPETGA